MRPKLATHLSPAEIATLNVTSRSFANLNVTSTTQRRAAAPITLLAPEVDEAGSFSECEATFAASCAGQATCCYLCFPDGTIPTGSECLFDPAACVYCYRCAPSCGAPPPPSPPWPPPSSPPPATATLATFCPTPGRPAVAPATAFFRNASVERSGCYLFHRLEAPRAGELDGSAAAASFVLTTTLTPSHNSSILRQQKVYAQLEHVLTTRTVYLVEAQRGWRSCCKTNCVSNATLEYDLWDAYTNIFEFATKRYPGRSVVVFEDDFFWSDTASAKLRDVAPFIAANASRHGHYFLGMIPFPGTMKPLTSDEKHWSVSNGGACHAVVHTPRGMATIIERYRGDPCLASMYTRPATPGGSEDEWCHGGKCVDKDDLGIDFSFARDDAATYTEPLAFQLFPATENRDQAQGNWKKLNSAGVQILNGDKDPSFFYAAYAAAKLGPSTPSSVLSKLGIDWNAITGHGAT